MRRTILAICVVACWLTASAGAVEPAGKAELGSGAETPVKTAVAPGESAKPAFPERELEFKVSDEPYPLTVSAKDLADPRVLELRYVATADLRLPVIKTDAFHGDDGEHGPLTRDAAWLSPHDAVFSLNKRSRLQWQSLLPQVPKDRRPSEHVVADFEWSFPRVYGWREEEDEAGNRYAVASFVIRAATAERAKESTRGLLALLDYGICHTNQQECRRAMEEYSKVSAEVRGKLGKLKEELAAPQKKWKALAEFEDLGKEALAGLTTQKRMIAVEIAGAEAQIDACSRLLKDLRSESAPGERRSPSSVEQVEGLKIAAEIELVGLTARKNVIDEMVKKGRERLRLAAEVSNLQRDVGSHEGWLSKMEKTIEQYEVARKANVPFPVEGKIVIRPIRWVTKEGSK